MSQWFPENVSSYGGQIDSIFTLIFWIVGIWFVAAEVFLLFCVLRYRRRASRPAAYVRGDRWTELAWLLVPAVVILALDLGIRIAAVALVVRRTLLRDGEEGAPPVHGVHLPIGAARRPQGARRVHLVHPHCAVSLTAARAAATGHRCFRSR